jgi:hypothetical protein
MADPSQPLASGTSHESEMKEHSDARFARLEEELARQNRTDSLKTKIIAGAIGIGVLVWAFTTLR